MNDMHEIITMEQANRLFLTLAIAGPLLGLAVGAFTGGRAGALKAGAAKGFGAGMFGGLILILWKVYNVITDHLGLDTVKNLIVNLVLFIGLGIAAGLIAGRVVRKHGGGGHPDDGASGSGGSLVGAPVGSGPVPRSPGAERSFEESDEAVSDL